MESLERQGLLYDFYGVLLTAHQRMIYEDVVLRDMSLTEIAQQQGISRQAAHDMIKRCDRILNEYEEKLQLIEKFSQTCRMAEEIHALTQRFLETKEESLIRRIDRISSDIMEL